ncbi:hypothetical protein FOWG_10624 [Fusarium oxysporum f. sp. lycopersici MN25]|nr:hypothetical protein FOWG_10624 [Fusarium oxysporum f. sp. lycopersici MN25]
MMTKDALSLATRPKFRRASGPKSRMGCITCKIRHLKCDEERPSCYRCRKDQIRCDGYASPKSTAKNKQAKTQKPESLSHITITHLVTDTPVEKSYFHHFYHWTCKQLSLAPGSSNFWIQHVLPLSHTSEPVKHAITAVAAAHQMFMAGHDPRSPQHMRVLTTQYTKALSQIIPHMSVDSAYSIQCALVCCLLFIAFEGMLGRYAESVRHLRAGNRLLTLPALACLQMDHPLTRKLNEIFSILSHEASNFMDEPIIPDTQHRWAAAQIRASSDTSSEPFYDLDKAAYELRELNLLFTKITKQDFRRVSKLAGGQDQYSSEHTSASFEELQRRFRQWITRIQLTTAVLGHLKPPHPAANQLLSLILAQKFWCMNAYFAPEISEDPIADFLDAAELLAKSLTNRDHFTFSLEGDLVSSLSFVVRTCSDTETRNRALSLLRSLNRREGIWDSREIVQLHEMTLSLDNHESWYEREVPGGVPGYVSELARISTRIDSANSILLAAGHSNT